ncbi:uncharacterized protein TNIN_386491 [Trichonephila inaurata madagascariensis]|uniref:Uncharacterized protein n=1 Tax=Trichonephila inaurata madagascariensis TaxID=2747483 RepID=A0A8X6XA52_9ARAC|nr:uncharacterized protein TNIN_386491 [Trichonephila inaurata madagascariensis]
MNRVKSEGNNETVPYTTPSAVSSIIPFGTLSPANSTNSGILRSPSHESFATDLSLMSLSSLGSEISRMRGSAFRSKAHSGGDSAESGDERRSPVIMDGGVGGWVARKTKLTRNNNVGLLQVPPEQYGGKRGVDDVLYEEENEAIRNCGALSSMLGLMRSFSTSDLDQNVVLSSEKESLRSSVSEMVLNSWKHYDMPYGRLEYTSRSCSTWVAVGDVSTTSQLPSPQTLANYASEHPEITAIDFVRAINKKVRQMYIRRRLESTYKALERLTRSELSLDLPSIAVPVPTASTSGAACSLDDSSNHADGASGVRTPLPQFHISTELGRSIRHELQISAVGFHGVNKTLSLTVKDIERDKGKPLSKYERNMMIFNWLQSLDENAFDQLN